MNIILALVALAGSTWALLKAIQTIRALEKKLKTLEAKLGKMNEHEMNVRTEMKMNVPCKEGHSLFLSSFLVCTKLSASRMISFPGGEC